MTLTKAEIDELSRAVEALGDAWARGDRDVLTAMLCPEYIHVDLLGKRSNYDEWLAYAAGRSGRRTRMTFRDVEIRELGEVAVVTGFNDISGGGALSAGDAADLSIAFTQVWVQRDGRWMRFSFQATPVKAALAS